MDIVVQKEFLNKKQCAFFINYFKENYLKQPPKLQIYHRETHMMDCGYHAAHNQIKEFKILLDDLTMLVKEQDKKCLVNYSQIVEWPAGERQGRHIDFKPHLYTSILYLNDDYEGGETVVGKKIIAPEQGKIILFKGNQIKHEVLKIQSGIRYTNATWYITK